MADLLSRAGEVGLRPDPDAQPVEARYVRSYLWMRIGIGVLGVALPLLLVFGDKVVFSGNPFPRGSLSAYYYSGMRDEFVWIMSATGVFLLTYKVAERTLDNLASVLAGACAVLIALFPTGGPSVIPLTPLQDWLGETTVKTVHFAASAGFLASLIVLSFVFGLREGRRPPRQGNRSPTLWRWFHWACTFFMALAIVWIIVTLAVGWPDRALLWGEWASAWAFGLSWLAKGAELDMLFGKPRPTIGTSELAEAAPTAPQPPIGVA
jgi:hypothetical protein